MSGYLIIIPYVSLLVFELCNCVSILNLSYFYLFLRSVGTLRMSRSACGKSSGPSGHHGPQGGQT